MKTHKSSKSENTRPKRNSETANKNTEITEKDKLLQEIRDLRCIIEQCEWKLETLRFKEVEHMIQPYDSKISHFGRTPNVLVELQNDLYRFAGVRCVKFKRDEFVFNFVSTNEQQKQETYAVQIFIKDGKGKLGKWVMPMSIDMDYMLTKTPIDNLRNITTFIKRCRHNIDCYNMRQEQFLSLKKHTSDMKNCTLESNIGYTYISMELYGVHDSKNDKYINLIIYLLYHSEEARPHKVEVDTMNKNKLSDEMKHRLKEYLKEFKISDMKTAFNKIFMENNSTFTWMYTDDSESPLEINNTSSSDEEGFLTQLYSDRKKSLRKVKRKRELQQKWKLRKKQKGISKTISDNDSTKETEHIKNPQVLLKRIEINKTMSSSKQQEKFDNVLEETTPMNKPKVKLKQTKLNFQINQNANSDGVSRTPLFESKMQTKFNRDKQKIEAKLFTSTPLHRNINRLSDHRSSSSLDIGNITDIEPLSKQIANKLNNSKTSSRSENKSTPEKTDRLLRNSTRFTRLLHTNVLEENQRLTRSMKR